MQRRWRTSIPRPWRGGTWKTRMERAREATPARQSTGDESSRPRAARQPSASLTQSIRSAAPSPPGAEIPPATLRSEEHTSELQSLMRISYAVFCLKKKKNTKQKTDKKNNIQSTNILN